MCGEKSSHRTTLLSALESQGCWLSVKVEESHLEEQPRIKLLHTLTCCYLNVHFKLYTLALSSLHHNVNPGDVTAEIQYRSSTFHTGKQQHVSNEAASTLCCL